MGGALTIGPYVSCWSNTSTSAFAVDEHVSNVAEILTLFCAWSYNNESETASFFLELLCSRIRISLRSLMEAGAMRRSQSRHSK